MAEPDQNQTGTGTTEATATPLDSILDGAADVPARDQDDLSSADPIGGIGAPSVPLKALKKERERRQKADKQVEELRLELERFDNAKFGWDETQIEEQQQRLDREEQQRADEATKDPAVVNYDRSLQRFTAIHGKEVVAKVDAALNRLNVEQRKHVVNLAGEHPDPVAAIHGYIDQNGLLYFKGQPLDQVLASKDQQPQANDPRLAQHIAQLNEWGQAVAQAESRANFSASKADFVSEYGMAAYNPIDPLSVALAQCGHPLGQHFVQAVKSSAEPVLAAAQLLHQMGLWQPQVRAAQAAPQPQMNFPSNLANRRTMGQRSGPGYAGPTPLNDIFRH